MFKLRYGMIAMSMLLCIGTSAKADVSIGIGLPNISIGINLPMYPELVRVPGYPVYYAPRINANYFFYDGMYWVYDNDNWYASSWYNGPWSLVGPEVVPLYVLRIPVRYYRQPPVYFRGWQANAPPHWGQHWGPGWEHRRSGWNHWNRKSAPRPAPLPVYQRQYSGDRYPHVEQQRVVHNQQYRYQPKDKVVRQHLKQEQQKAPAHVQPVNKQKHDMKNQKQPDVKHAPPRQMGAPPGPGTHPPQRGGEQVHNVAPKQPAKQQQTRPQEVRKQPAPAVHEQKRPEPVRHEQKQAPAPAPARIEHKQQPAPAVKEQHQQQAPKQQHQEKKAPDQGDSRESGQGHGQRNNDDRGQERNR